MDVSGRIAEVAQPAAESAGLVVDDVSVSTAGGRQTVVVTVDLPEDAVGSANLDDVAAASRAIGAALDEADVPEGAYTLEVSTPGIDRPLTLPRHFRRARTRLVAMRLADGSEVTGRVVDASDDSVVLERDGDETDVAIADVVEARVQVEMRKKG